MENKLDSNGKSISLNGRTRVGMSIANMFAIGIAALSMGITYSTLNNGIHALEKDVSGIEKDISNNARILSELTAKVSKLDSVTDELAAIKKKFDSLYSEYRNDTKPSLKLFLEVTKNLKRHIDSLEEEVLRLRNEARSTGVSNTPYITEGHL